MIVTRIPYKLRAWLLFQTYCSAVGPTCGPYSI